jgi:hypothetical protein
MSRGQGLSIEEMMLSVITGGEGEEVGDDGDDETIL